MFINLTHAARRGVRKLYNVPFVGFHTRRIVESLRGASEVQSVEYWNDSLRGWAASYLGGTLSIDARNGVTVSMAKSLVPSAQSLLDVGCAGGSLALALSNQYSTYWGVDISQVAIDDALKRLNCEQTVHLEERRLIVAAVQNFESDRKFDVIVFNEVLYYLPLAEIKVVVERFANLLERQGIMIVSLKDHPQSRLVQREVQKHLLLEQSVLFQCHPSLKGWQTVRSSEYPGYLIQAYRPRLEFANEDTEHTGPTAPIPASTK